MFNINFIVIKNLTCCHITEQSHEKAEARWIEQKRTTLDSVRIWWVRFVMNRLVHILFIKYKPNRTDRVWYLRKKIPVLRLLGRALFGDSIYLRRYPDSTGTLDSYRWSLPVRWRVERGSYDHVQGLKYELIGIGHMD